ncbi:MAG: ABC transporter permease [Acidimicrobiales bacterium]|nr:ABC transporter permease [Acidimicrobiales bacterium]
MRRLAAELFRYGGRVIGALLSANALVFLAIEISIPGGFRAVLFPGGFNTDVPWQREVVDEYRLDDPVVVRFFHWVLDALQGDFGYSTRNGEPVWDLIWPRVPISFELMVVGVLLALLIGLPLGVVSARFDGRAPGGVANGVLGFCQSVPVFITSLMMIRVFAVDLGWLPAATWVRLTDDIGAHLRHLAMPALSLAMAELGTVGRVVRSDLLRVLNEEFVVAANAKGLSARYVLYRHALRPASLGLLNVVGLSVGALLSGTILVEIIFGIGGLGQLVFESSIQRDLPVLLGLTSYLVLVYVTVNTVADVVMRILDPRLAPRGIVSGAVTARK